MRAAPSGRPSAAPRHESPAADGPPSFLVPLLRPGQELLLRFLTLAWLGAAGWFWMWWLLEPRGPWSVGRAAATLVLAWLFGLGGYFLFFACRMSRANPALPLPELRVAMVVTKAPSEPWEVVRQTLKAMLAQDFPYPYDVWLADERPSATTLRWCKAHRVQVSSRFGVAEYHQPTWPRRTRSKEGNLAYFYDRYGYRRYDVVAQLDSDHVPGPGYLEAMVRPFANPKVGYVAAPSICDSNIGAGWTVKGRLYREASLHGCVQAGSNGGWAPLCIGSHYAVRTKALAGAGGLGPELAEDYSTTLWLQTCGWEGTFAIDAEAHGEGPETFDDMLVQELQWSRSLGTILVRWAPKRFRRLPGRARARMSFALIFYPIQGLILLAAAALPTWSLVTRSSWGDVSLGSFYLHLWASSFLLLATIAYLRRCGVLRPRRPKLWSYELILFQLVRWPWAFIGFVQGMVAGFRSNPVPFRVTPKGGGADRRGVSFRFLLPALALGVLPGAGVILAGRSGLTNGLYLVALGQAALYLAAVGAVLALEQRRRRRLRHRPEVTRAPDAPNQPSQQYPGRTPAPGPVATQHGLA